MAAIHREGVTVLPCLSLRLKPVASLMETDMAKLIPLLSRLGLFGNRSETVDTFDLRLTRIGSREARARCQSPMFKNQPSHSAVAALS